MASKKPAKKPLSDSGNSKNKELLGKAIYYMGLKTDGFTCPACSKKVIKGIIYEHNNAMHCSRKCINTLIGA
jgi:hypothetical protein